MVILHFKRGDNNTFLYESFADIPIKQLLDELVACK